MTAVRFVCLTAVALCMLFSRADVATAAATTTATTTTATTLPNGWRISPAGVPADLGTLPLHAVEDPSGKWLAIVNGGYGPLSVSIVDEASGHVVASAPLSGAFYGIAFANGGTDLYVSTADGDGLRHFSFDPRTGALSAASDLTLGTGALWNSGVTFSADGHTGFAAAGGANTLISFDAQSGVLHWAAQVGAQPYAVVLSKDGKFVYVTNWAGGTVSVVNAASGAVSSTISACSHPNAELLSPDGKSLYVACANDDRIAVIETASNEVRSTIDAAIYPRSLPGAIPNGLALSTDGKTLFVADAGENAVAAVDVSTHAAEAFGAIPSGWYPTDVVVSQDGSKVFVIDGKGLSGHANPQFPHSDVTRASGGERYYVAALATGDVEMLSMPTRAALVSGLATARANAAYGNQPSVNSNTPWVQHVIYVIKENRTYDEVLGDDPRGNGDAALTIFGRAITPNIHRLVQSFVLLDNFYTDAMVSADGHNWSTAAYSSDYVDKTWPPDYADRGRGYDFEEDGPASPPGGYLWDAARKAGVSLRDYGEFVEPDARGSATMKPSSASLAGSIDPDYRGFDLHYSDQSRIDAWLTEFHRYAANNSLPRLEIVRLPSDHTAATRPGMKTPFAMLADNDYALGRLVDAVSHSQYWKSTVIFVLEDDAQAGPDHVSDQRAEALVIGGPVRRGIVDHTHYTTCSMLRTIELLLGMQPLSQFDAGATPMLSLIASYPDVRPWSASRPSEDLNATNPAAAVDARLSLALDLDRADADPQTLTKILYRYAAQQRHRSRQR